MEKKKKWFLLFYFVSFKWHQVKRPHCAACNGCAGSRSDPLALINGLVASNGGGRTRTGQEND